MNFASHYLIDHISGSTIHNFGLLFPDFMGMTNRNLHVNRIKNLIPEGELKNGIDKHLSLDVIWHDSSDFFSLRQNIKRVLLEYSFAAKPYRPFFISHVIAEIALDRMIVQLEPKLVDNMYEDIALFTKNYSDCLNFLPKQNLNKMMAFLDEFCDNRFVYQYAQDDRFISILNRMFNRVNNKTIEFEKPILLTKFVQRIDECVQQDYATIFSNLKEKRS